MIENGKDIRQVSYDKCCFVATKFSTWDQPKEAFLSRQIKICRDITFRVHNKKQQNFIATKIISIAINKNVVEVIFVVTRNSMSRQEIEE